MSETSYEVVEQAGKSPKWRLTFRPEALRLEPVAGGEAIEVPRAERVERLDVINGTLFRRVLSVAAGSKKKVFRLDPSGFEALEKWIGPPILGDLKKALKRRLSWTIPIGGLWILTSFPLGATPDSPALPFRPLECALGAALILLGVVSRLSPNRIFFILDSLWMGILAYGTAQKLLEGFQVWPALVLYLQVQFIIAGFREFHRFRNITEDLAGPKPEGSA